MHEHVVYLWNTLFAVSNYNLLPFHQSFLLTETDDRSKKILLASSHVHAVA